MVLAEAPMLAAPSPQALQSTCHQCLQPLPPGAAASRQATNSAGPGSSSSNTGSSSSRTSIPICSSSCSEAAERSWARSAAAADLAPLQEACRRGAEKFPLMLARLACLRIQQQQQQQAGRSSSSIMDASSSGAAAPAASHEAAASAAADAPMQGDPLTQLQHLCYANLPEVPPPWVELHRLLLQGLRPLCGSSSGAGLESGRGSSGGSIDPDWLERTFSLQWFSDALSRLHLNSFRRAVLPGRGWWWVFLRALGCTCGIGLHCVCTRACCTPSQVCLPCTLACASGLLSHRCRVDTVPPLDTSDPSALLRAAAASLSGADAGAAAHHTGSAAYLLASMLNHRWG